jgi:hypothetical protein
MEGWTIPSDFLDVGRSRQQAEAELRRACKRIMHMPPMERLVSFGLAALTFGMPKTFA